MFVLPEEEEEEKVEENVLEPVKLLDSALVVTLAEKESPSEVICQRQEITGIGDLKDVLSLRKINMSFNPIGTLKSIDQLKELRHLSAYCCRLTNVDDLCGSKRVEYLMLQQNGLSTIPSAFLSFNKLKELRIDRNQIKKLDNLSGCSSLRVLDISYNQLTSLEGIAGLQSLTEIRAQNNQVTTLKHLRALPNLKELNVSSNKLTNLIGLESLPSIEAISAEDNDITTIQIPQTYMSHLNKQLDKDGGGSTNKPTKTVSRTASKGADNTSMTTGTTSKQTKSSRNGGGDSAGKSRSVSRKSSSAGEQDSNQASTKTAPSSGAAPVVGLQHLYEIYLRGNAIDSLTGMEAYGTAIESIDFSDNHIKDSKMFVISKLGNLEHIEDIKLAGNDIKEEVDDVDFMMGDSMTVPDNSTIMSAKPSQVTATSTSRLLRKQSKGVGSKPPLDTSQNKSQVLSRRSSLAVKYANMSLEKALALACPTLQTFDDVPVDKLRTDDTAAKNKEAKENNGDKEDDGFHTWEDPSLSVVSTSEVPSESKQLDDKPSEFDDDDFKHEEEEEQGPEHYNANNPKLVVETIVSREEILMNETVFRGLLQQTKDTITKAVKDNLPPEVGEEVTDLVLNVRPVTKEHSKKPTDTTIGQKVRDMLEADCKKQEEQTRLKPPHPSIPKDSDESKLSTESKHEVNDKKKKPAQLTKNPSALSHDDAIRNEMSIEIPSSSGEEVILKASNRPNTPKTAAKIDRIIGSTKVTATGSDQPPPPVAQFDLRSIKRAGNDDIQSARGADERHRAMDDRRRVNSARMDSESRRQGGIMHSRMTTNSTSTVRLVNSNVTYHQPLMTKSPRSDSCGNLEKETTDFADDGIHTIDMNNVQVGMRRAGSAPLSTINSELDDDKSIQWNLMPPSELPTHVVPPPSTIEGTTSEEGGEFLTEVGADMESIVRRSYEQDTVRPSSSQSGVSLTKFRVPVLEDHK